MSEPPVTSPDPGDEQPTDLSGGWHEPQAPGGWRVPDAQPAEPGTWHVMPSMPEELEPEPEVVGGWHLPKEDDTTLGIDEQIEVLQPQEQLRDFMRDGGFDSDEPLVMTDHPAQDDDIADTGDLMALIESIDTVEDDFDTVHMSELVALASLAEASPSGGVLRGEDAPQTELAEDEPGLDEADTGEIIQQLSPAEQLMMQQDRAAADDPGAYARQRLMELGALDESGRDPLEMEDEDGAGAGDPGAYASQRLEELGAGEAAPAIEPLSPRELMLARQFNESLEKVHSLRGLRDDGILTPHQFNTELMRTMVQDDDGSFWVLAPDTDQWYRSENNQWVLDTPEVLRKQQQTTGSGAYQRVEEPLDYISDVYEPATSGAETPREFGREIPLGDDDSFPHRGMGEATIPSDAFGDATVPGAAYTDATVAGPTVQAQPAGYGTIEQPLEDGYDIPEGEFVASEYQRAVEQQRQSWARTGALLAAVGTGIVLLGAAGYIALALLWYQGIVSDLETGVVALGSFEPEFQTVTILDTHGAEIATLGRDGDDRRPVNLEDVSPYMIHAIIALEDPRFYEDAGWDLMTTLGAFGQNLFSGQIGTRGSSITRQVARDLVLQNPDDTPERRRDEIVVAGELTRRYTKNEILTLYLNEVAFFGNQTYGVEAAARFYFDKAARDLTFPEAAMLAAIAQSPDTNEPVNNRRTALALKDVVMERMAEVGCLNFQHDPPTGSRRFCINTDDLASPLTVRDKARVEARVYEARQFTMRYPHFISLVQNQIEAAYGTTEVYRRGFIVRTTLDPRVQDFAEEALRARIQQTRANGVNNGAIMVTDPRTGAIVALVGSPDFDDADIAGQIDYGRSYQRPGGAIVPLVYASALAGFERDGGSNYYTPATIVWDVPTTYPNGQPVVNFDQQFRGAVNVRSAMQNNLTVPAVRTYNTVGTAHFRAVGEALGLRFRSDEQFGPPTAVNETEVRLYDMMKAYGAIANGGTRLDLHTIDSITDADGNPVAVPAREDPVQALSAAQAYLMVNMLSDDQARSGQFGVNSALTIQGLPAQNVVGAVAGTNSNANGLWTIGFTNNRVVGVWLGTSDGGPARGGLNGFTAAAPLWNQVMRASLENNAPRQFVQPDSVGPVQVCADTGAVPTQICANVRSELFANNQQPPPASQGFSAPGRIDSWTGLRANEFCPDNIVEGQFVTIQDPAVINWLNNQGQAYARRVGLTPPVSPLPDRACDQSTPIPVARISSPSGGQTVMGTITINGQVNAEGFNRYQLEVAPAGTEDYRSVAPVSSQQHPEANSVLGSWDTTTFANGDYTLRLAVFANNGGYVFRTVAVRVDNPEPTATPTPEPTFTPEPGPVLPPVEDTPLPFDPIPGGEVPLPPAGPTPTIDPTG